MYNARCFHHACRYARRWLGSGHYSVLLAFLLLIYYIHQKVLRFVVFVGWFVRLLVGSLTIGHNGRRPAGGRAAGGRAALRAPDEDLCPSAFANC